jgi:hypothetical protein
MAVSVFVGDRVLVPTDTEGLSGTYALGTTAVQGYLTPANAGVSSGSYVAYTVVDSLENPTQFEIGEGVFTAGSPSTIARTVTIRNHTGGTGKVNWGAGTKYLFLAPSAAKFIMYDSDGNFSLSTPLTIGSGTVSNTALSPINDRDTGPYFPAPNTFAIAAGGSKILEATPSAITLTGEVTTSSTVTVGVSAQFGTSTLTPGVGNSTLGASINANGSAHFSNNGAYVASVARNSDGLLMSFGRNATAIGTISITAAAVAYNTTSDYRLKENFEPIDDGIEILKSIPTYRFNWKKLPEEPKTQGFIAHEVQAVIPNAVFGTKDGEQMQGIDHSKMVPVLWAAVQQLVSRIETLESQFVTLSGSR